MKDLIVGDLHIDRKEHTIIDKIEILDSIFTQKCNRIIILGDIFNNGKQISTIASQQLQLLFEKHSDKQIIIIVGNHDIKFKSKISPNTIETAFKNIKNVTIVDKPLELDDYLLIPWICESNYQECVDAIKQSDKKYCCGHFSINGFQMTIGIKCYNGLKQSMFDKFEQTFSGHFHLHQKDKNIIYVGSIYQESWSDFNNQKGYYVVDDKIEFKSVDKQKQIYYHIDVKDSESDFEISDYKDCHIKLFHKEKLSKIQYEKVEELKEIVCSYKIEDQSIDLVESKIEKIEFSETLVEFLESQEMKDDYKKSVEEYILIKYREVG